MTTPSTSAVFTVGLPPDADLAAVHRCVLASVPERFRLVTSRSADIHVVAGRGPDWVRRAALAVAAGPRAVVIAAPEPALDVALAELQRDSLAAGVLVVIDHRHRTDPAWCAVLPDIEVERICLLDSVVSVPRSTDGHDELGAALLTHIATVRPLLDVGRLAMSIRRGRDHYVVTGTSAGAAVGLTGVIAASQNVGLRVDVAGVDRRWVAVLPGGATGEPATVTRFDADGEHTITPRHESGHRTGWIALHEALTTGAPPSYDLTGLRSDQAVLDALHPRHLR